MDPIQVSTIESAILNNLLSGDTCKFIEVVKPLGITDYTGANLFGDSKIDALLNDAMKKIEDGESCDTACTNLMTYVQSANDPTTVNASMVEDLNNNVSKISESLSKLTNIISNFSIDGSSKEFQDGKELAKSEPGKSKDELDVVCSKKGLDGQDAANFKFGYNSVDKKAPNIGSGESKIDQNHSESSSKLILTIANKDGSPVPFKWDIFGPTISSNKDELMETARKIKEKYPDIIYNISTEDGDILVGKSFSEDVNMIDTKEFKALKSMYEGQLKDVSRVASKYGIKGLKVNAVGSTPNRGMYDNDQGDTVYVDLEGNADIILSNGRKYSDRITGFKFSEVKNMSKDDKVKDAVKGKVTGTYKWSKDGSTLAVIGVSEDEFKTWKDLVKDVLGDEVTVIGVRDSKDLPSNIQFCDESTNIEYSEDPNKYYDNCTDDKSEFAMGPSPAAAKLTKMVNGNRDPSLTSMVEEAAKLRMNLGLRGNMEDIWITMDEAVRNNPKRTREGWLQEYYTGLVDLVGAFKNMSESSSDGIPSGTDKVVDKEMKKEMKSMIPTVNSSEDEGKAIEKLTKIAEIHNDNIKSMSESVTKLDPENLMIAISKLTDIVTKNTNDIKTMSDKIAKFCESADNDKKVAEVTDKKDKPVTEPEAVNHSFSITNAGSADRYQSLKSLFTED